MEMLAKDALPGKSTLTIARQAGFTTIITYARSYNPSDHRATISAQLATFCTLLFR